MVQNAVEEKRVLEVTKSVKKARDRAAAIEWDYKTLSVEQWCERYDVPVSFVSEQPLSPARRPTHYTGLTRRLASKVPRRRRECALNR